LTKTGIFGKISCANRSLFVDFGIGQKQYQLVFSEGLYDEGRDVGVREVRENPIPDERTFFLYLGKTGRGFPVSGYPEDFRELAPFLNSFGRERVYCDKRGNLKYGDESLHYRAPGIVSDGSPYFALLNAVDKTGGEFAKPWVNGNYRNIWPLFKPHLARDRFGRLKSFCDLTATLFPKKFKKVCASAGASPRDPLIPKEQGPPTLLFYDSGQDIDHAVALLSADTVRTVFTDYDGQKYIAPRVPEPADKFYHSFVQVRRD
jgi:hypothetical protein